MSAQRKFSPDGKRHLFIIDGVTYSFRAPKADLYYFDEEEAQRWVDWFKLYLKHTEGEMQGEPLELLPWCEAVVRELFGWRRRLDGARRYQTAFICVPGKNGKTQLCMGLALGLTAIDEEPGAQVYWAAATKDQAELTCWKMITDQFADESSDLHGLFELYDSAMSAYHAESKSRLKVISSLPTGKHGFNVSGAVLDEIHETPHDEVRNVLRAKMTTRKQPLLIYITTAGKSRQHWSRKEYDYAKSIDDGSRDTEAADRYLVYIREADERIEPQLSDPKVLKQALIDANPGIGKSVKMDNLLLQWEECQDNPAKRDMFLQCQLNMWVERYSDYLPRGAWESCAESFSLKDLEKRVCFVGVDLSESQDMTAVSLVFPFWDTDGNGIERVSYRIVPYYFVPQQTFEKEEKYHQWLQHNLEVCGVQIIEYATVRARVKRLGKELFKAERAGLDPAYANEFATQLRDTDGIEVEFVRQKGWHTAAAVKRFRELVMTGQIRHNNNPILNWNVQNAKVIRDKATDLERLSKLTSSGKIDGLMACIFALHCAMDYVPTKQSVYETRGIEAW